MHWEYETELSILTLISDRNQERLPRGGVIGAGPKGRVEIWQERITEQHSRTRNGMNKILDIQELFKAFKMKSRELRSPWCK